LERAFADARISGVNRSDAARIATLLLGATLMRSESAAAPSATQAVLQRMRTFYRDSPGLVADFKQILESRTLPRPQEEKGVVSLKFPGRMRWEYSSPPGKLAVTDGSRAYLYLPEDKAVLVGSMTDLDAGAVTTRLLLGDASLEADFVVEGAPAKDDAEIWILKLTPRGDFPYDSLVLDVEAGRGAIRRIRLVDPLGNRMEYRFDRIRVEKNLSEKIFTYRIPRGVEIQTFGEHPPSAPASP
jgi:outer membrane lipoprotein carrier protein